MYKHVEKPFFLYISNMPISQRLPVTTTNKFTTLKLPYVCVPRTLKTPALCYISHNANNTYLQDGRHPLRGALVLRHDNAKKRDPSNNRWQLPFMKNLFLYKSVRKTEASWFHADIYQDNI